MRRIGGTRLSVTGFLACPCHLIITLLWPASGLSGTALGSFLKHNTGLVTTFAGIYARGSAGVGASFLFNAKRPGNQSTSGCSRLSSLPMRTNLNPGSPRDQRTSLPQGENTYVNPRTL